MLKLCLHPCCSGSDPTKLIEDLAKRKKIKTLRVSMGQGQEIIADKLLTAAAADGHWLLLQNTHLGLNYLTELEGRLSKADDLHEDFRWVRQSTAACSAGPGSRIASSVVTVQTDQPLLLVLCSPQWRDRVAWKSIE